MFLQKAQAARFSVFRKWLTKASASATSFSASLSFAFFSSAKHDHASA